MDRWEYKYLSFGGVIKAAKSEAVEEQLNELGQEGWEAVGISHDGNGSGRLHALLKRRIDGEAAHKSKDPWGKW